MEKIFFVQNGDLNEVNHELGKGGKIKMIQAVSEVVSTSANNINNKYPAVIERGNVYAFIVVDISE